MHSRVVDLLTFEIIGLRCNGKFQVERHLYMTHFKIRLILNSNIYLRRYLTLRKIAIWVSKHCQKLDILQKKKKNCETFSFFFQKKLPLAKGSGVRVGPKWEKVPDLSDLGPICVPEWKPVYLTWTTAFSDLPDSLPHILLFTTFHNCAIIKHSPSG